MGLEFIKINSKFHYFKNTCGFDSLAQIMLAAALDFPVVKEIIAQLPIPFFIFINNIINKGITSYTYCQRGSILLKFSDKQSKTNPVYVDCATAVNTLHEYLFKECPSFCKFTKYSNKCPISKENYPTHIIQLNMLCNKKLFSTLRKQISRIKSCSCGSQAEVDVECGK